MCLVQIRSCVLRRPTFAQIGVDRSDKPVRAPGRPPKQPSRRKRRGPDGNPDGAAHRFTPRENDQPVVDGTVIVPAMMSALAFSRSGTMSSIWPPDVAYPTPLLARLYRCSPVSGAPFTALVMKS